MVGKFITIEGVEGVGKSTIARYLEDFLTEHKKNVFLTREPGGTPFAEDIRNLLLHQEGEEVYPETELLLFFASRKQHIMNFILPHLNQGNWVICDRYLDASYAYQGAGRKISKNWLDKLVEFTKCPMPDLTILLTASEKNVEKRMAERSGKDRIEKEKMEFFKRVEQKYLELAKANPDRFYHIDANQPLEVVKNKAHEIIIEYL